MKHIIKNTATAVAAVMLTGCASSAKGTQNGGDTVTENAPGGGIALIEIETKDSSAGVMDFVTEPVAPHVAKQISSWTPGYVMPPEPYYEECTVTVTDSSGNKLLADVGANVKVRGNWTTTYEKKPLRIKFDEKQSMLGMNGGAELKNWVLLAEYKDASMLRDKAALAAARGVLGKDGLYAADAQLAEVTINGEYWGVYLVTELQQVGKHRVDITEPEENYTGTDIGYFLEFDGYFYNEDPLHQFHVSYADNAPLTPYNGGKSSSMTVQCLPRDDKDPKKDIGFTIKSDIYSQEQHDFIANYVENVYKIMYYAAYNDEAWAFDDSYAEISLTDELTPRQAVEQVVNVDSLADMYIISELTCDADIYWSSFFMDVDFGEGGDKRLTFEAPWDFDSGLGNKNRCADGSGFYAASIVPDVNGNEYKTINPWLAVIMHEDWYQDIIRDKWTAAYDSGVFADVVSMVESDKTELSAAFTRNYDKWDNIVHNEAFAAELSYSASKCSNQTEAADFLINWLNARIEFMNGVWHK